MRHLRSFLSCTIYVSSPNVCHWVSDLCPHRVYNFSNDILPKKQEGRQSRFLSLIFRMDPMTMVKATGKAAKPFANGTADDHIYSGIREANRYRAVTTVKNVLEVFSFLHVLQLVWNERGAIPPSFYGGKIKDKKFQLFAEQIQRRYADAIKSMSIPKEPHAQKYLMKNWHLFRKIGRMIMKNGWYFPQVWKA